MTTNGTLSIPPTMAEAPPRAVLVGTRLLPPEVEAEYRSHFLKEDRRALAAIVLAFGVLLALFAFSDPPLVADAAQLRWLWPLRGAGLAGAVLLAWATARARSRAVVDGVGLLWVLLGTLILVAIQSTRPRGYFLPAVQDGIFLLVVWTILPVRFAVQVADAAIVTGGTIAYLTAFRDAPAQGVTLIVAVTLAGVNLLGASVAYRAHRSRRRLFLAIREEEAAARQLRESGELLRSTFDGSSLGMAITDVTGRFTRVNQALGRMLGYAPEELVGKSFSDVTHPDDQAESQAAARDMLAGTRPTGQLVKRYLSRGGETVWAELAFSLVRGEDGLPRHFVTSVLDIGPRKRAEEALRESERRYRLLADHARDVIWVLDLHTGRFSYVSPAILQLRGLTVEEAMAEPLESALTPESLARVRAALEESLTGHGAEWPVTVVDQPCKDGSVKHVEVTTSLVRDAEGRPLEVVGVSRDATARIEALEALRTSERRLRLVARNFPDGSIVLFDERDRVLFADGSILFLGVDPVGVQGRTPADYAPPDLARQMKEALARARSGEIVRVENRIGPRLVETQVFQVLDEGRPSGQCVMVSQDVTRRRQTEANLALAARLASLGTLVAGVSHEINNPLAGTLASVSMAREGVEGMAERLREGAPLDRDDLAVRAADLEDLLEDASAGAQRIARIVKDMALFGRPDRERKRVRLVDVVDAAMRWLPPAVGPSTTIRVEDHGPPDVIASAGQLEQVLVNLVANADKAARPGEPCHVTIALGAAEPGVAFVEVRDDGVGMTPEIQARIFDPFFTTREVGQGMGIGLPVCHSIVAAHGGSITVTSAPGEGSTFRVELPAAAA